MGGSGVGGRFSGKVGEAGGLLDPSVGVVSGLALLGSVLSGDVAGVGNLLKKVEGGIASPNCLLVISTNPYLTVLFGPVLSGVLVLLVGDGDIEVPWVLVGMLGNGDLPVEEFVDDGGVLLLGGEAGEDLQGDAGAGAVGSGELESQDGHELLLLLEVLLELLIGVVGGDGGFDARGWSGSEGGSRGGDGEPVAVIK